MNISPSTTAKLALINIKRYSDEKEKEYSRARMSKDTVRWLSGRTVLRDSFIEELTDAFRHLGWHFFTHNDTEFALLQVDKANVWPKISSKRVRGLIQLAEQGIVEDIDDEYQKYFGHLVDVSDDD